MTQDQKQKSKLIDTSVLSKKRGKSNTNKLKENSCHVINNCCRLPALKEKKKGKWTVTVFIQLLQYYRDLFFFPKNSHVEEIINN